MMFLLSLGVKINKKTKKEHNNLSYHPVHLNKCTVNLMEPLL